MTRCIPERRPLLVRWLPLEAGSCHRAAICDAFNQHDLDAIMAFFADDGVLEMPRGPHPWGQRFEGRGAVRGALASRFVGIPDVHSGDGNHWVCGDFAVSEWTLTGTMLDGPRLEVRGCDHRTFRDGMVVKKDSYWKIVEPEPSSA